MSDYNDLFDRMVSELRKESPKKCQSCELLFASFRDGDKGEGWYMDCETKPDCYQSGVKLKRFSKPYKWVYYTLLSRSKTT
jgi:hypothetical protein